MQTAVFEIEAQPAVAEKAAAPAFSEESIRDAAAMINAAKRPVLYLGGGVINAPARVRELAEKAQLPTTMTLMALGMLPKAHPLSLGMLGMHGVRSTNYILQEADLLIVLLSLIHIYFKLVLNLFTSDELYDRRNDPNEMHNLIDDIRFADVRSKMHDALLDYMDKIRDPFRSYQWSLRPDVYKRQA